MHYSSWQKAIGTQSDPATSRQFTHRFSDLDQLDQLAGVWDSLAATSASPMQQYIWARACTEAFDSDGRLSMVAVGSAAHPVALAPLVNRGRMVSRLEMLGVRELYEPMDFLYADPSHLPALANALAEMGAVLYLGRLPADSPVIAALRKAYRLRGWVHTLPAASYPYIALNADWMEPERQFNAGRRSDFRRAQRHADKMGSVSYEVTYPTPAELDTLLEEAYAVESAGWKADKGTALKVDPALGAFYRRYAAAACEKGILRLFFFRIDGRAVAMQLAVECFDRFWLLKIGYDERFSRCSPGTLLMLHTLKYAAERGLGSYEFLGLAESWTSNWTQTLRPSISLRAYPLRWQGIATLIGDLTRLAWIKLRTAPGGGS
jgi:CelD/BcsL family acetyltransferase involved in cellulose biosynthesis